MRDQMIPHPKARHNGKTNGIGAEPRCPVCGQPLGRKEFRDIQARIEREERDRIAHVERNLKKRFERERAQAEAKVNAALERARTEGAKVADTKMKAIIANQEATIAAQLEKQRQILDKAKANAIAVERAKAFEEKARLTAQLAEMQRKIERKTAHELGEPAEVDLFENLKTAFPYDKITRVAKGTRGADVIIEVIDKGTPAGKVVVDVKNHKRWQNAFITKLRSDQLAAKADFAVLCSSVFPAGERQLYLKSGVIVADPARVPALVTLLRRAIIENHRLTLGARARNAKAEALFAYIASTSARDLLDRIVELSDGLIDLDRSEHTAHQKTWSKRADLVRGVQAAHAEFSGALDQIIERGGQ